MYEIGSYYWSYGLMPVCLLLLWLSSLSSVQGGQSRDADLALERMLGKCQVNSEDFDECMKIVLNEMRVFYQTGIPDYNIRPFDPHHADFVELRRGNSNGIGGFKLVLRNVSEYGWARSDITKYRTDFDNQRIIYSQYFPEKSLEGWYEFSGKLFSTPLKRQGFWNMTLYDYSQTTTVHRLGDPGSMLKVNIEIDKIGGLKMHISDFLVSGNGRLNELSDNVINSMWPLGLPVIKPIINELISTAFTDIFNESFRYFPIDKFLT